MVGVDPWGKAAWWAEPLLTCIVGAVYGGISERKTDVTCGAICGCILSTVPDLCKPKLPWWLRPIVGLGGISYGLQECVKNCERILGNPPQTPASEAPPWQGAVKRPPTQWGPPGVGEWHDPR